MEPNIDDFQEIASKLFYGKRYDRLESAVDDILQSDRTDIDIVVIPPDVDSQTDEE